MNSKDAEASVSITGTKITLYIPKGSKNEKKLKKKGFLKWQLKLNPGETKTIDVHYAVEYPKDTISEEK